MNINVITIETEPAAGMRLVDANSILATIKKHGITDGETIIAMLQNAKSVKPTCDLENGDIVYNTNNHTYGIVLNRLPDKNAVSILEKDGRGKFFVNCPPLAAIVNTGKRVYLANIIKKALEE